VNRRYRQLFRWLERVFALAGLNLAFFAAAYLRSVELPGFESAELSWSELRQNNPQYYDYYVQLLVFFNLLAWLLLELFGRSSEIDTDIGLRRRFGRSLRLAMLHALLFALLVVSLKGYYYSRLFGLFFYSLWLILLLLGDAALVGLSRRWLHSGRARVRAWLVGDSPEADRFFRESQNHPWGIELQRRFAPSDAIPESSPGHGVDELYLALEDENTLLLWQRYADRNMLRVRLLPKVALPPVRTYTVYYLGRNAVVVPREEPLELAHNRWIKRGFDLALALPALAILAVCAFPIIALSIRLSSRGSVWYSQKRSGLLDREFTIFKFRTMEVDGSGVTRIGRFLRRHNLDELPQLWNVIRGEMSLVGPRPHMLEHTHDYRRRLDEFMLRHLVPPGLTGLAQVSGWRGAIDEERALEERVKADVYYLENWSLLLDLKIIAKTVFHSFFPPERAR